MGSIFSWLVSFVLRGLGIGGGPKPTVDQQTEKDDGAKTVDVESLEAENAQLKAAATDRATADAASVRADPSASLVNTDPGAAVNKLPDEHFRD